MYTTESALSRKEKGLTTHRHLKGFHIEYTDYSELQGLFEQGV